MSTHDGFWHTDRGCHVLISRHKDLLTKTPRVGGSYFRGVGGEWVAFAFRAEGRCLYLGKYASEREAEQAVEENVQPHWPLLPLNVNVLCFVWDLVEEVV